jgi:Domain of unknown function (DUF4167)
MNQNFRQGQGMRPGQKNRMRGRNSGSGGSGNAGGGRRGPNPLTRSFESNGPDVKVRGTPQHIAEKYIQLARDAHSAGDTVMAEAYLQYAEHYYRIISAWHAQQQAAYNLANGIAPTAADNEIEDDDDFEPVGADRFVFRTPQSFQPGGAPANGQPAAYGQQPFVPGQTQPFGEQPEGGPPLLSETGQPVEGAAGYQPQPRLEGYQNPRRFEGVRPERGERPERGDRPDRGPRPERGERRFGRERPFGDRPQNDRFSGPRTEGFVPPADAAPAGEPRSHEQRAPEPPEQVGLPSFLTAPIRPAPPPVEVDADAGEVASTPAPRKRRQFRAKVPEAGGGEGES